MLLLLATTDKIQLVTSAAATLDVVASIQDKTTSTGAIASASQRTAVTTATTTDIVSGPSSGIERNIVELTARNKHATQACDVTVLLDANGTDYEICKFTLAAGDTLEYVEGIGWFTLTEPAALFKKLIVTSDVVNATTSFADITGLTCAVQSGKSYNFHAVLFHQTNATTTGAQFGVNTGTAPTSLILSGYAQITASVTAATYGSSAAVTARDTAMVVETTGPGAVNMIADMHGWIVPAVNDTFAVRCKSEVAVASGLTVKAGSYCLIWEATG